MHTDTQTNASIKLNYYHDKSFPHNHKSFRLGQEFATIAAATSLNAQVLHDCRWKEKKESKKRAASGSIIIAVQSTSLADYSQLRR